VKKRPGRKCDFPGCTATDAKRTDIPTNQFRGDDVVLNVCKEHRKPIYTNQLLATEKAKKQM
jgi:hypothetical protein